LKLLIVKVVDDIPVCGPPDKIQAFYKDLSRTSKLIPLRTGSMIHCSGMVIVTDNDGSTTIDFAHYLAACSDIPLSAQRRKQQDDECTPDERTAFRTLCGKLSYMGATGMPQRDFLRPSYSSALLIFAFPIYARQILLRLLCAAKDETSVDTMRRMFCCDFLRKSRL
jgi:hypothetical protein